MRLRPRSPQSACMAVDRGTALPAPPLGTDDDDDEQSLVLIAVDDSSVHQDDIPQQDGPPPRFIASGSSHSGLEDEPAVVLGSTKTTPVSDHEREKQAIQQETQRETRRLLVWRLVVGSLLMGAGTLVSWATYHSLDDQLNDETIDKVREKLLLCLLVFSGSISLDPHMTYW